MEVIDDGGRESVVLVLETGEWVALFFTEARVIVAHLGRGIPVAVASFGGAVGGLIAGLSDERRRSKRIAELRAMPPSRILISSEKSYAVTYDKVDQITFAKKGFGKVVRITAAGETHEFFVSRPKEIPNYAGILSRILGGKVDMP